MQYRLIVSSLLAAASVSAYAQTAASTVQRDVNQEKRIEQGLQSGALNTREAATLQREESRVDRMQSNALKDGKLSAAELPAGLATVILPDPQQLTRSPEAAADADILVSNHWRADYPPAPKVRLVQSVATGVGFIALAGVAAEFGVVMLLYLKQALDTRGPDPSREEVEAAVREGALLRVRPKAMTVAVIVLGLIPIMIGGGTGSEVMSRIAAPMIGGMLTAPLLSMFVIPAAYLLMRSPEARRRLGLRRNRSRGPALG